MITIPHTENTTGSSAATRGTTVISRAVVAKVAGLTARQVQGVHTLGSNTARALGLIREVISSADLSQGVSVEVDGDQVSVELAVVVAYPAALQQVSEAVREAVIGAIESLVGLDVTAVNITISDVHLPETGQDDGGDDDDDDRETDADETDAAPATAAEEQDR